ncbi:hypothetical protein BDR26DRAFT_1007728 [Obelidium mucronatum]|nr:hypothetical protein BDR26DRAFT_1007728 [Obelidium mucronatum]
MPATNLTIIRDIRRLRAEVLAQTDRILSLLTDEAELGEKTEGQGAGPQGNEHLNLGIRWSERDYHATIDANLSHRVPVYTAEGKKSLLPTRTDSVKIKKPNQAVKKSVEFDSVSVLSPKSSGASVLTSSQPPKPAVVGSPLNAEPQRVGSEGSIMANHSQASIDMESLECVDTQTVRFTLERPTLRASFDANQLPAKEHSASFESSKASQQISVMPSSARKQSAVSRRASMSATIMKAKVTTAVTYYHWSLQFFLLPAFHHNGSAIPKGAFDMTDLGQVSFAVCGFHPRSLFSTGMDLVQAFVCLILLWILPYLVTFHDHDDNLMSLAPFSWIITAAFFLDTCVTFLTPQPRILNPIYNYREYEMLRPCLSKWMRHVLVWYFPVDLITLIPFEKLFREFEYSNLLVLIRLLRCLRLPQLLGRCVAYRNIEWKMDAYSGISLSKVIPLALSMIFFLHFNACTMYYLGKLNDFPQWEIFLHDVRTATISEFYSFTYFHSVGNLFPLSFMPNSAMEQMASVVFIILGAVLYAFFIGSVSSAAMSVNPAGRMYSEKLEELRDYIKWKDLSEETQSKLFHYYETKYRGKYFEEAALLDDMNESLKAEICLHNTRDLIVKVPFLRRQMCDGRDDLFIGRIAQKLNVCHFIPGDYVVKQGDTGVDMFFILSGKVDVFVDGRKVVSLDDGAYIGEVALIMHTLRTATVQAVAPSVLYRLKKRDFEDILADFSDMKKNIDELAMDRQKVLKSVARNASSKTPSSKFAEKESRRKSVMWEKTEETDINE